MPVLNDLTDEERAEFAQHGVTFDDVPPTPPTNDEPPVTPPEPAPEPAPAPAAPAAPSTAVPLAPAPADTPPAPQPAAMPPAGETPPTPPPGFVPHQALHAERLRVAEATRQAQLATARLNRILQERNGAPTVPQMPSLEEDPAAYIRALEERINQFDAGRTEQAEIRELETSLEQDERLFALATPDYEQAQDYYIRSRAQELLVFYTPEEAQKIMQDEVRNIARQSWAKNVSAAQNIYILAQSRGYRPGAPPTPELPAPAASAAPAPAPIAAPAPAPAAPAPRGPTPAATVAAVQAGQQTSSSLSTAAGAPTGQALNAEALLAMSDEEFEKYMQLGTKNANARFAEIGGR